MISSEGGIYFIESGKSATGRNELQRTFIFYGNGISAGGGRIGLYEESGCVRRLIEWYIHTGGSNRVCQQAVCPANTIHGECRKRAVLLYAPDHLIKANAEGCLHR